MRRRRIDPNKIVLGMMPRACKECTHIQHVFFRTQEEYDAWDCPVCAGRIEAEEETTGD
jgi:ribosomal protein S27E